MRYYIYGFRGADEFFGFICFGSSVGTAVSQRRRERWTVLHRKAPCASQ